MKDKTDEYFIAGIIFAACWVVVWLFVQDNIYSMPLLLFVAFLFGVSHGRKTDRIQRDENSV